MSGVETVTIINKSGRIVSTGRQIVNILKDATAAYQEKKIELKTESSSHAERYTQVQLENRSVRSSHRSSRLSRSRYSQSLGKSEDSESSILPLTAENLSYVTEGSLSSVPTKSRRSASLHQYHNRPEDTNYENSRPDISRRHTAGPASTILMPRASTLPPPYSSQVSRTRSNPNFTYDKDIDMNLAYGHLPYEFRMNGDLDLSQEYELHRTMSRLDELLIEAQCLHHTAVAIISHLQENPEAMAAVALTLAELSTILTKVSPSVLRTLATASPAIYALLTSPHFLIATGLAIGVTIVMFGGFQIVKQIQSNTEHRPQAIRMQSENVFDNFEMDSIKSWRRGVAEAEALSISSSVEGEYITPEAVRQRLESIRVTRRVESHYSKAKSICSEKTARTAGQKGSVFSEKSFKTASQKNSVHDETTSRAPSLKGSVRSEKSTKTTSHKSTVHGETISRAPSVKGSVRSGKSTKTTSHESTVNGETISRAPSVKGSVRSGKSTKTTSHKSTVHGEKISRAPSLKGSVRSGKSSRSHKSNQAAPSEAGSNSSRRSSKTVDNTTQDAAEDEDKKKKKKISSVLATIFEVKK
ncbi:hypothetical protein GcM1_233003 [Golovinomyces cichoracearum]|uniref:Mfs general substrate transporter n=1 Tax=Golovinomyces cichoracearum TaxID=62708 RepID=A0A420ILM9_9PEZI|nr:hypothetical protein GcM1_233003 [Golovinomyces cichoracearum]